MSAWPGAGTNALEQAALLIDADNFADSQAIDAAWAQLKARAGRVSVCRAYGNVVGLQKLAPLWRTLGARTFPNLSLEKNTTDAALIADAVALHFQQGVRWFAIASGDADFAPLAVRLREWGCQVWCFSMEGILFQGAEGYYDRVVRFSPQPAVAPVAASVVLAAVPKPVKPLVSVEPVPALPILKSMALMAKPAVNVAPIKSGEAPALAALAPAAKPKPLPKAPPSPPALPQEVQRILKAVPGLLDTPQMLNQVVPVLRQKAILGKTTKSTKFFARHAAHFKLSPAQQPTHLEFFALARQSKPDSAIPKAVATAIVASAEMSPVQDPAPVFSILVAAPEIRAGLLMDLGSLSNKLFSKGVISAPAEGRAMLEKYPSSFRLLPPEKPNAVQYIGGKSQRIQ